MLAEVDSIWPSCATPANGSNSSRTCRSTSACRRSETIRCSSRSGYSSAAADSRLHLQRAWLCAIPAGHRSSSDVPLLIQEADLVNEANHQPEEDFGLQFNSSYVPTGKRSARPAGCPTWAKPMQVEDWQRRGIVIWQNSTQRIVALSGIEAVHYLDRLRANSDWEQAGLSLTRQVHRIHLPPTRQRAARNRRRESRSLPPSRQRPQRRSSMRRL